jgi:putative membrane protein
MSRHSFSQIAFKIKTALFFILIATSIHFWVKSEYNGQQGDVWGAQKDMALAMLGSKFTAIIYI